MKIAVSGGAGFIGTNLLLLLRKRYPNCELMSLDVRAPSYPVDGVDYQRVDVTDLLALKTFLEPVDKIFHLAASIGTHESLDSPFGVFETNVKGTLNVLECARQFDIEVFVAGMPGIWNNPYSISKDAAIRMARCYYETYGTKVCVLRWFSVYGDYQYVARYNKAVPTFISQALDGKPLTVYGDGEQVADFILVDDAVLYAVRMLEEKQWGNVIECATGQGISVNDLVNKIIQLSGSDSTVQHLPMRQGEPAGSHVVADTAKIDTLFPDVKRVDVQEGLKRTIEYYRAHPAID